jgi:transcriptional regulator with XRE-family HTH domain
MGLIVAITSHTERIALMVKRAMAKAHINQAELGRRMHTSHGTVCRWVNGEGNMKVETLFRILDACDLEVVELQVRRKLAPIEAT